MIRKVIQIDEEKCTGCGICANACHEGAIGIVDGKAKLLRDDYCDGMGDCLPTCPTGAITFEEREAAAYDEAAVQENKKKKELQEKMKHAGAVVDAVKAGAIKHFFLVAGCDGAKPGRNYYTEFVKQTPADSIVLTLACGKYRFNDLDLGTIGGLPRLMDMGQCNDAYGAIQVAVALANAFGCGVNELPLSFVLSWYEQKAVCILLTLLHLGIKNIRLGPSLPAFVSPNILNFLVENFGIAPITTPEEDLAALLK